MLREETKMQKYEAPLPRRRATERHTEAEESFLMEESVLSDAEQSPRQVMGRLVGELEKQIVDALAKRDRIPG